MEAPPWQINSFVRIRDRWHSPGVDTDFLLDELAYAGAEHLDPDFVAGYDRKQGFPPVDGDVEVLRAHGALHPHATVVDLGAGTGRFAVAAAAHCGRVVAVDVSPIMVTEIRRRAAAARAVNIEVVPAGLLTYRHSGDPADAVHCRNVLHQVPDFWKGIALQRMADLLRPGGLLRLHDLVYDVTPAEAPEVLRAWLTAAATDPAVGYTAEDLATHVRTEFSTYRRLLESLLDATGFEVLDVQFVRRVYGAYTCRRR